MIDKKLKKLEKELLRLKPKDHNVDTKNIKEFVDSLNIPEYCREDIINNLDSTKPHGINFQKLKRDTLLVIAAYTDDTLIIDDVSHMQDN